MHFHLPKPLHGWREFAGEVGIIVVGVLIALAFEQVVANWQWHERSEQALKALRHELAQEDAFATEMAVSVPCVDQQLAALEDRVAGSGARLNPAPNYSEAIYSRYTFRAPSREWPDQVWQALVAEGVTSHLDPVIRQRVDLAYQFSRENRATNRQTDALAYRLQLLSRAVPLDPTSRNHLIEEIEEARGYFDDMKLRSNQTLFAIRASGLAPKNSAIDGFLKHSGTVQFCRAHAIPLGKVEPRLET
jgi:hypothetical protein